MARIEIRYYDDLGNIKFEYKDTVDLENLIATQKLKYQYTSPIKGKLIEHLIIEPIMKED